MLTCLDASFRNSADDFSHRRLGNTEENKGNQFAMRSDAANRLSLVNYALHTRRLTMQGAFFE